MIKKPILALILFISASAVSLTSCKEDKNEEDYSKIKGHYFSVRQFALDEWNTFYGEPFLIVKTVRVNDGPFDSSYTSSDTMNWGKIFKEFFDTEISDRKYLGKYKFTQFDDDQDDTHNFFYEAKPEHAEELYTRQLLIAMNKYNKKVQGIYIKAISTSAFDDKVVKLYYKPMKRIQIQTTETPVFGEKIHTVTEWEFIR